MSTATKDGGTSTAKPNANGTNGKVTNGVTPKNPVKETGKNGKVPELETKPAQKGQVLTIEQQAMAKLEKQTKLGALIQDVQDLRQAKADLDAIKSNADLEISFKGRDGVVFKTTKSDTVLNALQAVQESVDDKANIAQQRLVDFEF